MRVFGPQSWPAAQAMAVTVVAALPVFLVGALAVQLNDTLGIRPGQLGLAAGTAFTVSGLVARRAGRLVQAVGARRGMVGAALLSTISLTITGLTTNLGVLLVAMVVCGLGNATAQPAANLRLSTAIRPGRFGLAFGIKQSSIPIGTLGAGLAVPGIALTVGWRWACATAAALALVAALIAGFGENGPHRHRPATPTPRSAPPTPMRYPRSALSLIAIGGGLGAAASTALGVFLVGSAVHTGIAPGTAGFLFAICSAIGIVVRIGLGWSVDRGAGRYVYLLVSNLLAGGTIGYLMLALRTPAVFVAGSLLAYGAGWTFTGLLHYAVVRDNRGVAASATGILQTGLSLGAAAGPLIFGLLVAVHSYGAAWIGTAAMSLLGAVFLRFGRQALGRAHLLLEP